jgi:hypothetical protein
MHGLQVRHGGDGQDAFRLIPIDSFGDYAVARNAVIASKLGKPAKAFSGPDPATVSTAGPSAGTI